jgi:hypothetical protein
MIKLKEKRRDYYRSLLKVASPSRASIELLGSRSCVCAGSYPISCQQLP